MQVLQKHPWQEKKKLLFMQVDEIEEDVKAIIEPIVDHSKHVQAKARHE